jgi:hypothetical protein
MTRTALAMPDDSHGPEGELVHAFMQAAAASYGRAFAHGSFASSQKVDRIVVEDVDVILTANFDTAIEHALCQVKSALDAYGNVRRYDRASPQRLTGLAVFIAGDRGAALSDEWRSHLSGETGRGLPSRRQQREALKFVRAAVACRMHDVTDLAWRPVDTLLESRGLSNLTVVLATLVIVVFFLHRGGLNDLADNLVNVAVVTGLALGALHGGRRYRQVKPPKRKPRRSRQ